MSPDQEDRMRSELSEYDKHELIDLNISLQETINGHVAEKGGFNSQVQLLNRQNAALLEANAQLEAEATGVDPEEVAQLNEKVAALEARVIRLTELNEKLQEKL